MTYLRILMRRPQKHEFGLKLLISIQNFKSSLNKKDFMMLDAKTTKNKIMLRH